jgi:hypothetical protein
MSLKSDKLSSRSAEADPWGTPLHELSDDALSHARKVVAGLARDAEDARLLLSALGLA